MAPKKKKGSNPDDPDPYPSCFFEKSPFCCDSMTSLQFKAGHSLKVHPGLLHRTPKLARLDVAVETDPWTGISVSNPQIDNLKRISRSAGHVLVQYLYTDSYRTMKWTGPNDDDGQAQTIALLETAFEVYATAREFDLEELEALSRDEIASLSKGVDAFAIVDIVKKTYPCTKGNDTWFPVFIRDTVRTAFEAPPQLPPPPSAEAASETTTTLDDASAGGAQTMAQDVTLAKLLLQGALDVYREKMDASSIAVKKKKKKGCVIVEGVELASEPVAEAVSYELEPEKAETNVEFTAGKKDKKKKEEEHAILEELELAPKAISEEVPEPVAEEERDSRCKMKKKKCKCSKCRKRRAEPVPEPESSRALEPVPVEEVEEPEVMVPQPAPDIDSPVEQGWVGGESDPWSS